MEKAERGALLYRGGGGGGVLPPSACAECGGSRLRGCGARRELTAPRVVLKATEPSRGGGVGVGLLGLGGGGGW